jgi:hypothetical protein
MWLPDDVDLQAVDWDELPTSQSEPRQSRALTEARQKTYGRDCRTQIIRHEHGNGAQLSQAQTIIPKAGLVGLRYQLYRSKAMFFLFQQFVQLGHQLPECVRVPFHLDLLAQ